MDTDALRSAAATPLNASRRLGEWFSEWSLKYIPDPYTIAILLTFVTFAATLAAGSSVQGSLDAWYDGVWSLLPFMATLSVTLMLGDAVAKSPAVTRFLERIAGLPTNRYTAVWFTAFVASVASLFSWALGLIVGATMAKHVAYRAKQKDFQVHYPLLAAAGYISLMTYGHGLTSSAALIMADPSLIPATFPSYVQNGIPVQETLGNVGNIVSGVIVVAVVPLLMAAMHPRGDVHEIPDPVQQEIEEAIEQEPPEEPLPEDATYDEAGHPAHRIKLTLADRLNNSHVVGLAVAVFPAYYFLNAWVFQPGSLSNVTVNNLTLNSINALFLFVAILLWTSPIRIVQQMKDSVNTISGIIFQFPFYAGIAGLLTGTGLATALTGYLAEFATPLTWPIIGLVSCGIVNVFIPSGGGQWIAQGPILLETTRALGMPPSTAVILEMLGDQLTNMVQPFWAIPLLAIANLRARDIIGYTAVAMIAGYLIVGVTLTVFLGM